MGRLAVVVGGWWRGFILRELTPYLLNLNLRVFLYVCI